MAMSARSGSAAQALNSGAALSTASASDLVDEAVSSLEVGRTYSWDELGLLCGFKGSYLGVAGGMVAAPKLAALLLITHPGGAKSFDYGDTWDGADLLYTGRGKTGDQAWERANRDVGENQRALLVFEAGWPKRLRFLGRATCVEHWEAQAPDSNNAQRRVFKFRLRFFGGSPQAATEEFSDRPAHRPTRNLRTVRRFDPSVAPTGIAPAVPRARPEETLALKEKALQGHHGLLVALESALRKAGWSEIGEAPGGLDLWGLQPSPANQRVIFEAKTITPDNEVSQCRSALGQLLEYRFFDGSEHDEICLVTDSPLSDHRSRFLVSMQVTVLWWDGGRFRLGAGRHPAWTDALTA